MSETIKDDCEKSRQIGYQVNKLWEVAAKLETISVLVEDRLKPLTHEADVGKAADDHGAKPKLVPLAEELNAVTSRLGSTWDRLNYLLERLEL